MNGQPAEITLTRHEAIDMLVAMEEALDVLSNVEVTAAAFALAEQRDSLFDRLWPNFPHHQ